MFLTDADAAAVARRRVYGEFFLDADARAADVFATYGDGLPADVPPDATLGELFRARSGTLPTEGDTLHVGGLEFTIVEAEGERIRRIGLHLPR
jgi:cell volume regulation protein A